jgi:hypothetical protein
LITVRILLTHAAFVSKRSVLEHFNFLFISEKKSPLLTIHQRDRPLKASFYPNMAPTMRRMAHLGADLQHENKANPVSAPKAMKSPLFQPSRPSDISRERSKKINRRENVHRPDQNCKIPRKPITRRMRTQIVGSQSPPTATAEPVYRTTAISTPQSKISPDVLPEIPTWLVCIFGMLLLFGLVSSILLYYVNFPAQFSKSKRSKSRRAHAYRQVDQHDEDVGQLGEDLPRLSPSGGYRPKTKLVPDSTAPQELHFRNRNKRGLTVDTQASRIGLGLTVPQLRTPSASCGTPSPGQPAANERRSLTRSLHSSQSLLNSSIGWEEIVVEDFHADRTEHNLESGLAMGTGTAWLRSTPSPSMTASSRSSSSSQTRILAMLGDGVERVADCLVKMLDDHVQDGDAEGGLLLPVQDSEGEEWPPLEMSQASDSKKRR